VPERRAELTTEGGLDVRGHIDEVLEACRRFAGHGIRPGLFIDADERQIEAVVRTGAPVIELHTGCYADATTSEQRAAELFRITAAARLAVSAGLEVHAGHGLNYHNIGPIAAIAEIVELNIGHAIVARALFTGLAAAVADMKQMMRDARAA
jgi:pyridoxine 5-phosphate synthase